MDDIIESAVLPGRFVRWSESFPFVSNLRHFERDIVKVAPTVERNCHRSCEPGGSSGKLRWHAVRMAYSSSPAHFAAANVSVRHTDIQRHSGRSRL